MPVTFNLADVNFKLRNKILLRSFLLTEFRKATGKSLSLNYVFCSDEFLLNINKQFLQHDYYTDIITFPLSETDSKVESEIYISIDRVADNAKRLKTTFEEELVRVIFHGVLHLAGYADKTKKEQAAMRSAEDEWIKKFRKLLTSGK